MSGCGSPFAAGREALERAYGLALDGLSDAQLGAALAAAGAEGAPADWADPAWLERVLDKLPIDESWLFRDEALWTWLRDEAGPPLLERALSSGRPVRALSIGCSAGQEPFSVAILFQHLLQRAGVAPSTLPRHVSILGVDPSPGRIAKAREGVVGSWSVERCAPEWLRGRVLLEDPIAGRHRVDPTARAACRFEVENLLALAGAGNPRLGGYDLVLCRNVFIYFRPRDAERIAQTLARGLDRGALLVVSAAEAHLLDGVEVLERTAHLGAARVRHALACPDARTPGASRRRGRPSRARATYRRPSRAPREPAAPAAEWREVAVAHDGAPAAAVEHVRAALEHASAGRSGAALRAARAAAFQDPRCLLSRLVMGRELIAVDEARGGEVLRALLDTVGRLPQDAEVPAAASCGSS